MKTSNKLFGLAILLVIILPPLVISYVEKSVRDGGYTLENFQNDVVTRAIDQPFEVVKLITPMHSMLRCYFIPATSENMKYSIGRSQIFDNSNDSVQVYHRGDTLYVEYIPASSGSDHSPLIVNLHLPKFQDIVVDGAMVQLDSLWQPAKFTLLNDAVLSLLNTNTPDFEPSKTPRIDPTLIEYNSAIHVKADNGSFSIGKYVAVQDLEVDFRGSSRLFVDSTARVGKIRGTISPDTKLNVSPNAQKKLQFLIAKDAINKEE